MKTKINVNYNKDAFTNFFLNELAKSTSAEVGEEITVANLEGYVYEKQLATKTHRVTNTKVSIHQANSEVVEVRYSYKTQKETRTHIVKYEFSTIDENHTLINYAEQEFPTSWNFTVLGWIYWNIFMRKNNIKRKILAMQINNG